MMCSLCTMCDCSVKVPGGLQTCRVCAARAARGHCCAPPWSSVCHHSRCPHPPHLHTTLKARHWLRWFCAATDGCIVSGCTARHSTGSMWHLDTVSHCTMCTFGNEIVKAFFDEANVTDTVTIHRNYPLYWCRHTAHQSTGGVASNYCMPEAR